MARNLKKLISRMTLEEKASLCSGMNFWKTEPVERLGIPSIMMADGPHGLRKQTQSSGQQGINDSIPATCFPTGSALACSWDRDLLRKVGKALGEECQAEAVDILLGPAINMKRSPLCGRNFEYYSEDPYLAGELAAGFIQGVQSRGVGTAPKHFAANNQEHRRMSVDAIVDERTLREIYLAGFESAVKESAPWTVMCSYNKVNGIYGSENKHLLTDILRNEWGYQGFVVSDWSAVNDRVVGLVSGLDLEMPSSQGIRDQKIVDAVQNGELPETVLDQAVERLLNIIFKAADNRKPDFKYDPEAHHHLAGEAARECMVLLKNDDHILPLPKAGLFAVIGAFAKNPRYQGGGSSHINPVHLESIYDELVKAAGDDVAFTYAAGYQAETDTVDPGLIHEACEIARQADRVILFAGLPDHYESEGYDREHLRIPDNQQKLIEAVADVQPNLVVVLSNGSPLEMPWLGKVKGVLEAYLGGEALGSAVADILFGYANPCGKLAETFPEKLQHNPSYLNFPGEEDRVEYREGLFIGYRYYDAKRIEPLFPFGFGLSYTSFEYTGMSVDQAEITDAEQLTITLNVKNTGKRAGKEIVQLYVRDVHSSAIRPEKELKGFEKVELEPGEEKKVTFTLDKRAFAYYDTTIGDWHVESGAFDILTGSSSRDIRLTKTVQVRSTVTVKKQYHLNSTIGDLLDDREVAAQGRQLLKYLTGEGGLLNALEDNPEMAEAMAKYLPLRAIISYSGQKVEEAEIIEILNTANRIKGQ